MKESPKNSVKNRISRTGLPTGTLKARFSLGAKSSLLTESLILARGRIQWHKTGSYTLISTRSANIRVWWVGRLLPPSIFVGNVVNFMGRFMTYNEGKSFWVVDALPFDGKYQDIVRPLQKYVLKFCQDPRDWLEKESMKYLDIKDGY